MEGVYIKNIYNKKNKVKKPKYWKYNGLKTYGL